MSGVASGFTETSGKGWPPLAWTARAMPAAGPISGRKRVFEMDGEKSFLLALGKRAYNRFYGDDNYIGNVEHFSKAGEELWDMCGNWENARLLCQSPIEEILLGQIVFVTDGYNPVFFDETPELPKARDAWKTWFTIQAPIGPYRADFLFTCIAHGHTRRLAVECDGHDFHERTKQQAQRDRARDRFMVAEGITVIRFTGSEIYRDPEACAEQLEGVLSNCMDSAMVAAGLIGGRKDRP
jgi:very-short-patch-repair endonuclease